MGQYHMIFNKTKKEYFRIGGAKLWEQAHRATAAALLLLLSNSNGRGGGDFNTYPKNYYKLTDLEKANQAIIDEASGRWAGDAIVVQGDYAEKGDPGYIDDLSGYEDVTSIVADALLVADDGNESEVTKIIEVEYSSHRIKGETRVEKAPETDRNDRTVMKYQAIGFSNDFRTVVKRAAKSAKGG